MRSYKSRTPKPVAREVEGGLVNRLKVIQEEKGIAPIFSAEEASEIYKNPKGAKILYQNFYENSKLLNDLGITHNLAPVIDLNCDVLAKIKRSYGDNINTVIEITKIFAKASIDAGVTPCFKHLPGLDLLTNNDTHTEIAESEIEKKVLQNRINKIEKLIKFVYQYGKNKKIKPTILLNHGIYKKIDDKNSASISLKIIQLILNKYDKYDVRIITDDLCMNGIVYNEIDYKNLQKDEILKKVYFLFCHIS